jgi:hypothetical protein
MAETQELHIGTLNHSVFKFYRYCTDNLRLEHTFSVTRQFGGYINDMR